MDALEFAKKRKMALIIPLIKEASKNGIAVSVLSKKHRILKFSFRNDHFYSYGDALPFARKYPLALPKNKDATKKMLLEHNISTPNGIRASSFESAKRRIHREGLAFPLILKPIDGLRAIGVHWDITSNEKLREAVRSLKMIRSQKKGLKSDMFIVEEQFTGEELRVLVLRDKAIACAKKMPATITGDGTSSINDLIKAFNKSREKGFTINVDNALKDRLKKNGMVLESIPLKNEKVQLRNDMMLANGGRSIDLTHNISQELEEICVRSAKAVGLEYAGIDILVQKKPNKKKITPLKYMVIEVNTFPGHVLNEAPLAENAKVNVSKTLLRNFLPKIKK